MLRPSSASLVLALASTACASPAVEAQPQGSSDSGDGQDEGSDDGPAVDVGSSVPTRCGRGSSSALARCVEPDSIRDDTAFIADIRVPGTPHWLAVQELCADRLGELGFSVEMHEYGGGTNVIGRRPGISLPHELVLVGAHYDHIPECLGADDNASGVAGALEVARVLSEVDAARTLAVACWDQEEIGLIGSAAWVGGGLHEGERVAGYFNYDMIGYATEQPDTQRVPVGFDLAFPDEYALVEANEFRGDFIVVVTDELSTNADRSFSAHAEAVGLSSVHVHLDASTKTSPLFSDLQRSDHAPFWYANLPAMFFTDSGEFRHDSYHCIGREDRVEDLDFEFAGKVVAATVGAMADTLLIVAGE